MTFGCRVNQADSLGFEEDLLAAGAEGAEPETADLVIVNTCSVTATADQGARQTIRRVARNNPHARIVVTGCYATRRPDEIRALPNVSTVVSNNDKPRLVPLLRGAARLANEYEQLTTAERFGTGDGSCGAPIAPGLAGRTAFTLRVQTGCAEPCAYCIIPSTRGRPRRLPTDEILEEVDQIVAAGFKEIVLTGVHLGSYGGDLTPPSSLVELLRALAARVAQGFRPTFSGLKACATTSNSRVLFRISSLEPMDCTRDIIDIVATSGAFAPHFHLPLQHASDAVLTRMRRPYTLEFYSSLVDDIRRRMPAASIGSD